MLKSSKQMLLNILHTPLHTSRLLVTVATRDSFLLKVSFSHGNKTVMRSKPPNPANLPNVLLTFSSLAAKESLRLLKLVVLRWASSLDSFNY